MSKEMVLEPQRNQEVILVGLGVVASEEASPVDADEGTGDTTAAASEVVSAGEDVAEAVDEEEEGVEAASEVEAEVGVHTVVIEEGMELHRGTELKLHMGDKAMAVNKEANMAVPEVNMQELRGVINKNQIVVVTQVVDTDNKEVGTATQQVLTQPRQQTPLEDTHSHTNHTEEIRTLPFSPSSVPCDILQILFV